MRQLKSQCENVYRVLQERVEQYSRVFNMQECLSQAVDSKASGEVKVEIDRAYREFIAQKNASSDAVKSIDDEKVQVRMQREECERLKEETKLELEQRNQEI